MPVTAQDVISDTDVKETLEVRTEQMYQFRRAFRDDDATDINSGSKSFPQATDEVRGTMDQVTERSDYPEASMNYEGINADYEKEGFIIRVSDEAVDDSVFDVVMDVTEQMGVAAEKRLDAKAFSLMDPNGANNLNSNGPIGTDGNDLNFAAVVDSYTTLVEGEFVPSDFELYCSPDAWGDLANDDNFNRATDQGDALARNGMLGEAFGVTIAMTNTGDLGDDEALMVDTGRYGYESTRWEREVSSEYDFDNDETKYKIRTRNDYLTMKPNAAIFLQGGV